MAKVQAPEVKLCGKPIPQESQDPLAFTLYCNMMEGHEPPCGIVLKKGQSSQGSIPR